MFSARVLWGIEVAFRIALLSSAVGLATSFSTATACVLGLYVIGLPGQYGAAIPEDALLSMVLVIMAASRCGDAVSADRWLMSERGRRPGIGAEYRWPMRAVQVGVAMVFFIAGVAKLRHTGLSWAWSSVLRPAIVVRLPMLPALRAYWGIRLIGFPRALLVLQWATLALELGFPIALFSKRARLIFVPAGFLLLAVTALLMGIEFYGLMLCFLFWIPWDALIRAFAPAVAGRYPRK